MSTEYLFPALKSKVGNATGKLILITLADAADHEGRCWCAHATLADRANCSVRSVSSHLKALEADGYITITPRYGEDGRQQSSVYRLGKSLDIGVAESAGGGSKICRGGVQNLQGGGAKFADNPPNIPSGINTSAWKEWIEYRKQARKKMTHATIAKQQKFLLQHDEATQQTIIDQSIQNGWTGLFKPSEKKNGYNNKPGSKLDRQADIRAATFDTDF